MKRIDDLIAEYAPGGVNFEPLANVGTWYGGGTPSKSRPEYWRDGTIPWVSPKDMGRPVVCATEDYITEAAVKGSATRLVPATSIAVVVRSSILDRILPTALIPVPVALNQDMKALVPRDDVLPEYVAHVLRANGPAILRFARKTGGSVASIESGKLFSYRIPVPPLEVQREIMRILDHFTALEAELASKLEAELEARSQQYAYFRNWLFSAGTDVHVVPMGDVGCFVRGRRFVKTDQVEEGIPAIHYGEIYTHYSTHADAVITHVRPELSSTLRYAQPGDVVIAAVGETVEDVGKAVAWLGNEEVAIHDDCFAFRHSMNPKYVAYYFQTDAFHSQKGKHVSRAKVKRLSGESLAKITIPVLPLEAQERIVCILDDFDALVNDLSVGLPAELAARRTQYEHYRDRLLTFEERSA